MIRATLYLVAAGIVWMAEGLIFAIMLGFEWWQTALMAIVYLSLWCLAARRLLGLHGTALRPVEPLPEWRYLSLAPMLVVVLGSFVSLPILLVIVALGKLA